MPLLVPMLVLAALATPSSREPRYFQSAGRAVPAGASAQDAERSKIRQHLRAVEETLREETPPDLSAAQREARARAMDALNEYRVRGQFPINRDAPRRTPVFIDNGGTPCAMGYLLLASGANALAREIATYENNDYVADIDHPGLPAWLRANGLRAEEAAWIQPEYGPCGSAGFIADEMTVCGADGRSYECGAAADCAGVDVVSEGRCGAGTTGTGTGTGTGSKDDGIVRADDVCQDGTTGTSAPTGESPDPATSGPDSTTSTSSGSSGVDTSTTGSTSAVGSTSAMGSTSGSPATRGTGGGCRVPGEPASWVWAFLVAVAAARRRRAKVRSE